MKLEQKLMINYFSAKLKMVSLVSKRKAAETALELFCTPIRKSKKEIPEIFQQAEVIKFEAAGHSIHGYRWQKENAKKILIIHGFESSSANYDRYISGLTNKGFEVIAFDAPAHGKSSGKTIDVPTFVATIDKVNEIYGPIDGFLAHSYGGLAVTLFLEKLKNTAEKKLVLIAPATETTTTINSFFNFLHLSKAIRKQFDNIIYEKSGFWPDHYSVRRAMNFIEADTLWFHDEEDQLTPLGDALKVREDNHRNICFRITKGLGHSRIYRDQSIIREILEFF